MEEDVLPAGTALVNWSAFALAPAGIYFVPRPPSVVRGGVYFSPGHVPGANPEIRFLDAQSGRIRTELRLFNPVHFGMSCSLDGKSLVFTVYDEQSADLMLIDGLP